MIYTSPSGRSLDRPTSGFVRGKEAQEARDVQEAKEDGCSSFFLLNLLSLYNFSNFFPTDTSSFMARNNSATER